jgi:hypothetical protein
MRLSVKNEIIELNNKIIKNAESKNPEISATNIDSLNCLLKRSDLDSFEKGWVYWQLQDHYALIRDYENLYNVFIQFVEYVRNYDHRYLFWTVCDQTQTLTMRLRKDHTEWDKVYQEANRIFVESDDFINMKFEMNRAYIGIFTDDRVRLEDSKVEHALNQISEIIVHYPKHPNTFFFKLTLYALKIKYNNYKNISISQIKEELLLLLKPIKKTINSNPIKTKEELFFGSWDDISSTKNKSIATKIGLHNIIYALKEAEENEFINLIESQI